MMLLGDGGTGKTLLTKVINAFLNFEVDDEREINALLNETRKITRGIAHEAIQIDPEDEQKPPLDVHVWDCAGQLEYYITHSFFISDGMYAVLLNFDPGTSSDISEHVMGR